MKKESWQGIKGSLVYEDDKAIIVDEADDIKDTKKLSKQLAEKGQPIKEARHQLLKNSIKKNIKTVTLNKAGYKVPANMGWFTGSMASDAKGSHQYLKQISENDAKAGDIVIVNQGAGAGNNGHTAILLGKWQGKETKIIQEGGDTSGHVNEGKFGTSFSTLLDGGDVVLARPVKK